MSVTQDEPVPTTLMISNARNNIFYLLHQHFLFHQRPHLGKIFLKIFTHFFKNATSDLSTRKHRKFQKSRILTESPVVERKNV